MYVCARQISRGLFVVHALSREMVARLLSAAEDVEETCSGVLDGAVKCSCSGCLTLRGVVLCKRAVELG